jgi:predicted small lipoprotein YifL
MTRAPAHLSGQRRSLVWAGLGCFSLLVAGGVAGCGQKGPLYLPEHNGTVITRPGSSTPAPQGTQQPATQHPTTDQPAGQTKKDADEDSGKK